jgi:MtN3 and saliva related transmembrane protein
MDFTTMLGLAAGMLTTVSFLPQLIKAWRTKRAEDISLGMLVILSLGIFLWLIYGIFIRAFPIIISNFASFILVTSILILKTKYR